MPSVIPGYEYDIFISYRHKDNKGDHWVTEFVDALKTELEATFKEDISIYFDANPHDGLLETHDVDDSLKDKLKCLIFIPIISQTYCDPKSFAWTHEFVVFKKLASEDQSGLKVKLQNGNVASRILPVKIHDLSTTDQNLVENEVGPIRGIEFIFKAMGVNRPLTPSDNPEKNLNQTYYKDQVNKVANSAREIIFSLLNDEPDNGPESTKTGLRNREKVKTLLSKLKIRKSGLLGRKISWILVTVLLTCIAAWGWLRLLVIDKSESLSTYSFIPMEDPNPAFPDEQPNFAISPDGRSIAFVQPEGIFIQNLGDFKTRHLKGTERSTSFFSSAGNPSFSPDNKFIVFDQNSTIKKYELQTGIITDVVVTIGSTFYWGSDNRIYFDSGLGSGGIWSVSDSGGEPIQVTVVLDSLREVAHRWPQLLPDNQTVIYTAVGASGGSEDSKIVAQRIGSNERVTLVEKAIFGRMLSTGRMLYATNDGNVFLVEFNHREMKITGIPTAVLSDVQTATWGGAAFLSVSETGNLVYVPRNQRPVFSLTITDEIGRPDEETKLLDALISKRAGHAWKYFTVSPNGKDALLNSVTYGQYDIWQLDMESGNTERLTFDIAEDETPVWSPRGEYFAYSSAGTVNSRRLYIKNIAGGSEPVLIKTWPRHIHVSSWSPDSLYLATYDFALTTFDIWAISVDGKDSIAIAHSKADETEPFFSPDGKWLAYQSNESGENEIYIVSFPSLQIKKQVSIGGGTMPRWDKRGGAIYYLQSNKLIRQEIQTQGELDKGKMSVLFETSAVWLDISPDGKKFYTMALNKKRDHQSLRLITNWFEDIKIKSEGR